MEEISLKGLPRNIENGWVVTKDHLDNEFSATDEQIKYIKSKGLVHHFKMYDDDGELYYSGYSNDDSSFNPLDDYGMPNAGTTEIRYREHSGEYKTLAKGGMYSKGGKYGKGGMESDKKCCGGYYKEGGILPDFNKVVSFKDLFTK